MFTFPPQFCRWLTVLAVGLVLGGSAASDTAAQPWRRGLPPPPAPTVSGLTGDSRLARPAGPARDLQRAESALRSGVSGAPEAKARLDRILTATPDDADARRLRAHALLALGRPAGALVDAERAVALRPESAEAHLLVVESARLVGNRSRAFAALDRLAALAVRDGPLHARAAWNAAELGDLERAESLARIAVTQDASRPDGYLLLARLFVLQRHDDAAAAVLARAANAGVVTRPMVQSDDLLARLADHPDVRRAWR
ncbi:MAG: hypothetical protein IAE99_08810 [Rhodothermales bacterium]|nr:hypothetical protein [Rhodothermales bacterium]MCA0268249.1 hypothetical protein [Bacteroidota bacterium]